MDSKKPLNADQSAKPSRRKFFIGAGATVGAAALVSQTPVVPPLTFRVDSGLIDRLCVSSCGL